MKKIISIDFNSLDYIGGTSTFNRNLSKIFNGNIYFITYYKCIHFLHKNETNIGIKKNIFYKLLNFISSYRLSSFLVKRKIPKDTDILIINSPSFLKSKLPGKQKFLILHQDMDIMMNNKSNFAGSEKYLNYVINNITSFIVPSEEDKIKLVNKYNIDRKKIAIIPHLSKLPLLENNICKTRNKKIIMVCRLYNKQKRIDLILKAMCYLKDWQLTIVGDGPDAEYLKILKKKNGLDNVIFYGPTEHISDLLDQHSIHIMSSDYEGFGLTNIEAMSRGLPIIIRDTFPAAKAIINDSGILLNKTWCRDEFIEAVEKIYCNYYYYSQNALINANKYSLEQVKLSWHQLLD
ncbi:glycosyltransferase [Proteus mirabilis]|uniref:glycosyltransferase n=1 Tax=Proteus mirabilis TaxID=584 RepID=UPI00218210AE|nr:glycosyltransferase [Proteus mirabilis]MCT0099889.1 glycosyltransferase [Proteus mirabilis]